MKKRAVSLFILFVMVVNTLPIAAATMREELKLTEQLKNELYTSIKAEEYPTGLFDFLVPRMSVDEDMEYVEFGIIRRGSTDTPASVTFKAIDLTAKYGEDYYIEVPGGKLDTENASSETLLEQSLAENGVHILGEQPDEDPESEDLGNTDAEDIPDSAIYTESVESYERLEAAPQYGLEDLIEEQTASDSASASGGTLDKMHEQLLGAPLAYTDWRGEYPVNVTDEDVETYNEAQAAYDLLYEGMQGVSCRLDFKPGEYMKILRFVPKKDGISEDSEQVLTVLLDAEGAALLDNTSGFIDIVDKDEPEDAEFILTDPEVHEGYAEFTLKKTAGLERYGVAHIGTAGLTAVAGTDYTPVYESVAMLAGQTEQRLRIPVSGGASGSFGVYLTDETYQNPMPGNGGYVTINLGDGGTASPLGTVAIEPLAASAGTDSKGAYIEVADELVKFQNFKNGDYINRTAIKKSGSKYSVTDYDMSIGLYNDREYDMRLFERISSDMKFGYKDASWGEQCFLLNRDSSWWDYVPMSGFVYNLENVAIREFDSPNYRPKGALNINCSQSAFRCEKRTVEWTYFKLYYKKVKVTTPDPTSDYAYATLKTKSYSSGGTRDGFYYDMGGLRISDAGNTSASKEYYYNNTVKFVPNPNNINVKEQKDKFFLEGINIQNKDGKYYKLNSDTLDIKALALGELKDVYGKVIPMSDCITDGEIKVYPVYSQKTAFVRINADPAKGSIAGYSNRQIIKLGRMDQIEFNITAKTNQYLTGYSAKHANYQGMETKAVLINPGPKQYWSSEMKPSFSGAVKATSMDAERSIYNVGVTSFIQDYFSKTYTDGWDTAGNELYSSTDSNYPAAVKIVPQASFTDVTALFATGGIILSGFPAPADSNPLTYGNPDKGTISYYSDDAAYENKTAVYNKDFLISPIDPNKLYQFIASVKDGYMVHWVNFTGDDDRDGNLTNNTGVLVDAGNRHYGAQLKDGTYFRPDYYGNLFNYKPETPNSLIYYQFEKIPQDGTISAKIYVAYAPRTIIGGPANANDYNNASLVNIGGNYYPPAVGAQISFMNELKIVNDKEGVEFRGRYVPKGLYSFGITYNNFTYQGSVQANGPVAQVLLDEYVNFEPQNFEVFKAVTVNGAQSHSAVDVKNGRLTVGGAEDKYKMSVDIMPRGIQKVGRVWIDIMRPGKNGASPTHVGEIPLSSSDGLKYVSGEFNLRTLGAEPNDYSVLHIENDKGLEDFPHEVGLRFDPHLDSVAIDSSFVSKDQAVEFFGKTAINMSFGDKVKVTSSDGGKTTYISINMPEISDDAKFSSLKKDAGGNKAIETNGKKTKTSTVGALRYTMNMGMTMAIKYHESAKKFYLSDIVITASASGGASVKIEVMTPIGVTFYASFSGDTNIAATLLYEATGTGENGNYAYLAEDGKTPVNISDNLSKFKHSGTVKVEPKITVAVGAEFIKLLSIEIKGEVAFTMTFKSDASGDGKVTLNVSTTLTALGFIKFNWNLGGKTYSLYSYGGSTARMLSAAMLDGGTNLQDSLENYSIDPLPGGVSRWNGGGLMRVTLSPEQQLLEEVYPNASPIVWDLGGGSYLMVFLGYYEGMDTNNRASLQYSIYNGFSWSEPQVVHEEFGRELYHDDAPAVFEVDGRLLVAWSRPRAAFNGTETMLEMMNSYDIVTKFFNQSTGMFENFQNVTNTTNQNATSNSNPSVIYTEYNGSKNMMITYTKADYEWGVPDGEAGQIGDLVFTKSAVAGKYYDFDKDEWSEEYPSGLAAQLNNDGSAFNGEFLLDFTKVFTDGGTTDTIPSGANPIITEAKLSRLDDIIVIAAIVDMDSNISTRGDRELFAQFIDADGAYSSVIRVTEDETEQSNLRMLDTAFGPVCLFLSGGMIVEMDIADFVLSMDASMAIVAVMPMAEDMPISEFEAYYDCYNDRTIVCWLQLEEVNEELGNEDSLDYYLCVAMGDYENYTLYTYVTENGDEIEMPKPLWSKAAYLGPFAYGNLTAVPLADDALKIVATSSKDAAGNPISGAPRLVTANIEYNDFDILVERKGGAESAEIFGGRVTETLSVKNNSLLRREGLQFALYWEDPQLAEDEGTVPAAELVGEAFAIDGGDTVTAFLDFDLPDGDFVEYWLYLFDENNAAGVHYGNFRRIPDLKVYNMSVTFTGRNTAAVSGVLINEGDKDAVNQRLALRVGEHLTECEPVTAAVGEAVSFYQEVSFTAADLITAENDSGGGAVEALITDVISNWPVDFEYENEQEIIAYAGTQGTAAAVRTASQSQVDAYNAVKNWGVADSSGGRITSLNLSKGEAEYLFQDLELSMPDVPHIFRVLAESSNPDIIRADGAIIEAVGTGSTEIKVYIYPGNDVQHLRGGSYIYEDESLSAAEQIVQCITLPVTVRATGETDPGSDIDPGGSSGSSGNSDGGSTAPADGIKVNDVLVGYTKNETSVNLNLSEAMVKDLIKTAEDDAVVFDLTGIDNADTAAFNVNAARMFSDANMTVTLQLPNATVTLAPAVLEKLAALNENSLALITVEATPIAVGDLTGMQTAQVKGYETVVNIDVFVGDVKVNVPLTVSLPYKLKTGEDPKGVCVWHLDDNGGLTKLNGVYNEDTGMVTFTVSHQSYYVTGYDPVALWVNVFSDVTENAWYYDAVAYANYYGLFIGDGKGNFVPQDNMTRAMFVTVLWNLEGKPAPAQKAVFTDVADDSWYHDAVIWAADNGIVKGIGGGRYDPGTSITRQEMAVMLYNYAVFKGYNIPQNREMPVFSDTAQIASWAETAARALGKSGVMSGNNNEFMPKKDATRAEVAQLFKNFIRFVAGTK